MGMGTLNLISDTLELKEQDGKREFSMLAYSGGAFDHGGRRLAIDLSGLEMPKRKLPMLVGHDLHKPAGSAHSLETKNGKLELSGRIHTSTDGGKEVLSLADDGFEWQGSVGLTNMQFEHVPAGKTVRLNPDAANPAGREIAGPVSVVRKAKLRETSFVTCGADSDTNALVFEDQPTMTKEDIALAVAEAVKEQLKLELPKLALMATGHPGVTSVAASEQTDPDADIKAEMVSAFGETEGLRAFELYTKNLKLGMFTANGGSK